MPVGTLSNFDYVLIFIYFIVLILIGYFSSRKQKEDDFLIAERNLGTWKTMFTVNASKTGATIVVIPAAVYIWGFAAVWFFIGMITGLLIFLPFALRLRDKSQNRYYTLADYFKYNYGKKSAILASLVSILVMFGFLVTNLIAGAKIFVFFTGWSFWIAAIIMSGIVLSYVLLAGFRAVTKTDILQYVAMLIVTALLVILLFNGSLIPASEWNLFSVGIGNVFGFFLIGIMTAFAAPYMWQRVYAAKSKKALTKGFLISVIFYTFLAILLILLALTVKVTFPNIDPDFALIHGFANLLPPGILGLAVILIFAAIMSSIDTYIFTAASSTIQDFFKWDKKKTIKYMKWAIFLITLAATIIVIIVKELIQGGLIFVSFTIILGIPILATWIKSNIKESTLIFSFVIGLIGLIGFIFIQIIQGEINPTIAVAALGFGLFGLLIGGIYSKIRKWIH